MLSRLVDEFQDGLTKEELKTTMECAKEQNNQGFVTAEEWQVKIFFRGLRRIGVSEGQLAFSGFRSIHYNETTPEKYVVARGK